MTDSQAFFFIAVVGAVLFQAPFLIAGAVMECNARRLPLTWSNLGRMMLVVLGEAGSGLAALLEVIVGLIGVAIAPAALLYGVVYVVSAAWHAAT